MGHIKAEITTSLAITAMHTAMLSSSSELSDAVTWYAAFTRFWKNGHTRVPDFSILFNILGLHTVCFSCIIHVTYPYCKFTILLTKNFMWTFSILSDRFRMLCFTYNIYQLSLNAPKIKEQFYGYLHVNDLILLCNLITFIIQQINWVIEYDKMNSKPGWI